MRRALVSFALVAASSVPRIAVTQPRQAALGNGVTTRAAAAANAFLASLSPDQRRSAQAPLNPTTRANWSNFPNGGAVHRNGVTFGELTDVQEAAALTLLRSALSAGGYATVMSIVDAEDERQRRDEPQLSSAERTWSKQFNIAILGEPATTATWMLQFGGHHLGINVTFASGQRVVAPMHLGTEPASYSIDGRTIRPLGAATDKAFALVNSLTAEQRMQTILSAEPMNLVLGPGEDGKVIAPAGGRASELSADQRGQLRGLIAEWVDVADSVTATKVMEEVTKHLGETYFAWAGPTTPGSIVYFRIQGPTVVIEYASQGTPDHIHTIYRDPTNDYAAKLTPR